MFVHILRYLQRGVYPLFYDRQKGFDYALYLALAAEAKYFGVMRLCEWIEKRRYLKAIKIDYTIETFDDSSNIPSPRQISAEKELYYYPSSYIKKVYVCPRGIVVHRGDPGRCGRQCHNAQGSEGNEYKEESLVKILMVVKEFTFDSKVCLDAGEGNSTREITY